VKKDNTATSAVIDVREIYSDDEVLVATAVKEEDSNMMGGVWRWLVLPAVGQLEARGKQRMLSTVWSKGSGRVHCL
jgi:hypothetical protein